MIRRDEMPGFLLRQTLAILGMVFSSSALIGVGVVHTQEIDRRPVVEIREITDISPQPVGWAGQIADELARNGIRVKYYPSGSVEALEQERERRRLGTIDAPADAVYFGPESDFILQGTANTELRPRFTDRDISYGAWQTNTIDIEIIDARTGEAVLRTSYSSEGPITQDVDQFGGNFGSRTSFPLAVGLVEQLLRLPEAKALGPEPGPEPPADTAVRPPRSPAPEPPTRNLGELNRAYEDPPDISDLPEPPPLR